MKTLRALRDPFIVHEATRDWAAPDESRIYADCKAARLKQNIDTPLDERIEYATWPETMLYLSTLSMDAAAMSDDLETAYRYTFHRYLDDWTGVDLNGQPDAVGHEPELTAYQEDRLDDLRYGIKKDRDAYFVAELYDELGVESIPPSFWLTPYEQECDRETLDEYAWSAVEALDADDA